MEEIRAATIASHHELGRRTETARSHELRNVRAPVYSLIFEAGPIISLRYAPPAPTISPVQGEAAKSRDRPLVE